MDTRLAIPDNQYLNIRIYNSSKNNRLNVEYQETRNSPVISDPSQYYMSVMRFSLPLGAIPLFRFKFYNNDPAQGSIYSITIVNGALESKQQLVFNLPNLSGRYSIYQVQQIIDMVNIAIEDGCLAVGIAAPYPYAFFRPETQLITMHFPDDPNWVSTYAPGNPPFIITSPYQLWMNYECYNLFRSLQILYLSTDYDPPNGKAYYVVVQDLLNGNYTPGSGYNMPEEFPTVAAWSDIVSIVFTTSLIPINKEAIAVRLASGDSISLSIITDIILERTSTLGIERTDLLYIADPLRLIDMKSSLPLRSFDFQVYYTDSEGVFYPAILEPSSICTLKMGFFKKSLYSNSWNN
jgi:hypothetical protein